MREKKTFASQLTLLSLLACLPPFILLLWVMVYAKISIFLILLTALLGGITIIFCHVMIHQKSAYQFRSLSNLLDAMIQGDYSLRARSDQGNVALNELVDAINTLALRLNKQHIESVESQLLLRTVINHIDVAIIALNAQNKLVLINPTASKLLQLSDDKHHVPSLTQFASLNQLGQLNSGQSKVMSLNFGNTQGKYKVHMEEFRDAGKQQKLLFITDVSTLLRSEERNAWQSLIRVISHEINNSLSPIASISQTLKRFLTRQQDVASHKQDLLEGLTIISQRTNNLRDFVNSYKQIARLPEPKKQASSILTLVNKVIPLYRDKQVSVASSQDSQLFIDPVQLEQVLINLIKNAVESVQNSQQAGKVVISWQQQDKTLTLTVADEGTGISNTDNLFVPFYTTKKQGSGIGLVLSRQILEVHGGQLTLSNRPDRRGCLAVIELPLL
jgi:two-component system nitrogen regulation sensor histidine kinase NtrY